MVEEAETSDRVIDSIDDISTGDGIYSEASESPYWVTRMNHKRVMLRDKEGAPHSWIRETFEASLDAHTWIHQSSAHPGSDHAFADAESNPDR